MVVFLPAHIFHDNSKNKNREIDFSFDSEHCATFWTIKNQHSLNGGGGLHVVNWEFTDEGIDILLRAYEF